MGSMRTWIDGDAYEAYVGRWSRLTSEEFVRWLSVPHGGRWIDVGCGTGATVDAIRMTCAPGALVGIDTAEAFVAYARFRDTGTQARFLVGTAEALPVETGAFDAAVSALVLNSLRDKVAALGEMMRAVRPGGLVAAYVWDYAGEMQVIRRFWDAAVALDSRAAGLDPGRTDTICRPERLADLFQAAGLTQVETRAIDVPAIFRNFAELWEPFLIGQGLAPRYCMSLPKEGRIRLREQLQAMLPVASDGRIHLIARAFAVRGTLPARVAGR
jgi:SAM-dependent methyltransferase